MLRRWMRLSGLSGDLLDLRVVIGHSPRLWGCLLVISSSERPHSLLEALGGRYSLETPYPFPAGKAC